MLSSVGNSLEISQSRENEVERETVEIVTVVCKDGKSLDWRRRELAKLSDYFRVLLYGNFRERTLKRIEFHHVDGNLLKLLLDFYESCQSKHTKHDEPAFSKIFIRDLHTAWELIKLSDMFGLENASAECEKYIVQTLDTSNFLEAWLLAEQFSRFAIQREIVRRRVLKEAAKCACIITANERSRAEVCSSTCGYTEGYHQLHKFYIVTGYFYKHFRDCDSIDATTFLPEDYDQTSSPSNSCVTMKQKRQSAYISTNSFATGQHYPGPHNEECRIAALCTDIYVTGGFDHNDQTLNEVWRYDTRNDSWSRVSDLRRARFYHCIASIEPHIFVCGGYDNNFVLDSLERYHPHCNEWVELAKMPTGVGNAAYASDENGIYVVCGQYGYKEIHTTNAVQYYATQLDQWTILTVYDSPVFYPHSEYGLSGAFANGNLFIIGGQTERCDVFDVKKKQWKRISNMHCRRMEGSVATYRGKVYVAGGYDYRTGEYHNTIEEHDVEENRWRILDQKLPRPSRSIGFCYVFDVIKKKIV